jgi:hypothetical protein
MFDEIYEQTRRDLHLAMWLWLKYPRQAQRLVDTVAESLFWLGSRVPPAEPEGLWSRHPGQSTYSQ